MRKSWKKMPDQPFSYSEGILQWLWEEQLFDFGDLRTTDGKVVRVADPGILNTTDGPDFKNARILIDGVLWAGAVELHLKSSGWNRHHHHQDEAYNQVVLHVVAENNPEVVSTENGTSIPTINVLPYLPDELHRFVKNMSGSGVLPCTVGLNYISEQAFLDQIEKAHREYLEKKGNDFLKFYNPELVPSKAWKHALILSVFDGLGITYNRETMVEVGKWFLEQKSKTGEELIEKTLNFAGFGNKPGTLNWNYKGLYPVSHPKIRIPQAVRFAEAILTVPTNTFFSNKPRMIWENLGKSKGISHSKLNILYGIVFLPAMFILGNLFRAHHITIEVLKEWNNFEAKVPSSYTKPFYLLADTTSTNYTKKLGVVHQYRSYCKPLRCHDCFVLKKVILS